MIRIALVLLILLGSRGAWGHKPSDSYLRIERAPSGFSGQWDIALRDLDYALGLDGDGDGAITWGELRARRELISGYALQRLKIVGGTSDCTLAAEDLLVDEHTDGAYAVLRFSALCPGGFGDWSLHYTLFFDLDTQHHGLLRYAADGVMGTAVLTPDNRSFKPAGEGESPGASSLGSFLREGVWHIWIGYDHILFLLSLLLPAVLVRESSTWRPAPTLAVTVWDAAKIVTAFTVAHSVTLSLAALGHLQLPSRWVESLIAASVLLAAANNLVPVWHRYRVLFAFTFGLVHGLGFASVLAGLLLSTGGLVQALFGFNLGVELGQLAIVAAFLPAAYMLSRKRLYVPLVLRAGSAGIIVIAVIWLAERSLGIRVLEP